MKYKTNGAALLLVLFGVLPHKTILSETELPSFHIEGTFESPWDSLLKGVAVARSKVTFQGEQPIRVLATDSKDSYIAIPRTEITFESDHVTKTVVANDKGFYQADLPGGTYKMIVRGPAIGAQALKPYVRLFRIQGPKRIVLNGTLYKARMTCDAVVAGDTEEEKAEASKNTCGGEDYFPLPSKDNTPFQLYIQYPQREASAGRYVYTSNPTTEGAAPVFVAYNLLSLQANAVIYDVKSRTIMATGNVVIADGSGATRNGDSFGFRLEDGEAIPLN
jgi:hypothetical protein